MTYIINQIHQLFNESEENQLFAIRPEAVSSNSSVSK
jgi:hypothetical protein